VSGAKSSSATGTTGTAEPARPYRGRFAPSPSGPLHFGSLVAAVASWLEARTRGGEWLVRIEDLDPPRERPGAADAILTTLEELGLHWDGPVLRQSSRLGAYREALHRLGVRGLLRPCSCSRAALAALPENRGRAAGEELYHPPQCLVPSSAGPDACAQRFRAPAGPVRFVDRAQGAQSVDVARTVGDFVLRRRDGLYAYQLAVVVDDADQGILDVVRGADLLASTPRQILVQQALDLPRVTYMHVPLAVGSDGLKLSKSEDAPGLMLGDPVSQLLAALEFLGQEPPRALRGGTVDELWSWARRNWRPAAFKGVTARAVPGTVFAETTREDQA
jgi:glutamyl-Q tRNA(Asp) synthetase